MLLSVVTVAYNDPTGVIRTSASVQRLMLGDVEHIIIDGSPDASARMYSSHLSGTDRLIITEPDDGIYDAMNKGLRRARGDYVLFMNAGDQVHPSFELAPLKRERDGGHSRVALGYAVESFEDDYYLNPGLGREERVFYSPQHQATFYPKHFYDNALFDTTRPVGADGALTRQALNCHGGIFLNSIVCIFELGGLSSSYGSWGATRNRLGELRGRKRTLQLLKYVLWKLVSQRVFYRLLASYKYTRLDAIRMDPARLSNRHIAFERLSP